MAHPDSRVTLHMAASLDGFIAQRDERADDIRSSILPVLFGYGIRFFEALDRDVALHLAEDAAY